MKIEFDLQNETNVRINRDYFINQTRKLLNKNLKIRPKHILISLFIVRPKKIKRLNQQFRNKNVSTTVLSFPQDEPLKKGVRNEKIVLGDIFICPEVIKKRNENLNFFYEHGLLHLLGLNHKQMEKVQNGHDLCEEKPSFGNSVKCALRGMWEALMSERNLRIHYMVAIGVIIAGFIVHISRLEWLFVFFAIATTIMMEIINIAIERILDLTHLHYDQNVRFIKDLFASVVLVSAFTAVVIGSIIFIPKIIALFYI
ncbi:MAG: rRNA maturation RNase YbeY [Patescibacteria group bacterium]|nr:rRNA maturation RNase YbeY [Patescibacteria group bacterium]